LARDWGVEMVMVEVGAHTLAVQDVGSGAPVLLVHGNFASKAWFAELLEAPPDGVRLVAFDLPNSGDSSAFVAEPEALLPAYAEALLGLVAVLGLTRPIVVGHSLGGAVVQHAVALQPEVFAGVVLMASSAPDGLVTPESHVPLLEAFRSEPGLLAQALAPMLASRLPPNFDALVADAVRMAPHAFTGHARALAHVDLSPRLAAYRGMVWVLRGALDPLIDAAAAERTGAAFVHASVQVETWDDVGHSPATEAPNRFAARLRSFVASVAEGGGG
jgi:pimeloyl-ACP methyl ester carboxylesterase